MNGKPASPGKGSAASQLEAIEKLAKSLIDVVKSLPGDKQDEKLLQLSLQFACFDFSRLKSQIAEGLSSTVSQPYAEVENQLEKLVKELNLKDEKIHEFKISLADSVMENKSMQRQLHDALEKSGSLTSQIAQMQLHSKDLTLKLSTAIATIEANSNELEALKKELMDLRSKNYQLKSLTAEYEDQLQIAARNSETSQAAQLKLTRQNEKLSKDFEHVITSNEMLKQTLESLEIREKELEEAIESLQREKNHLQTRIDKYVLGTKKGVYYYQPSVEKESSSVLNPEEFPAFLPFCFPERLPPVIKFRREIKRTWPAALKAAGKVAPTIFPNFTTMKISAPMPRPNYPTPVMPLMTRQIKPLFLSEDAPFVDKIGHKAMICISKPTQNFTISHQLNLSTRAKTSFVVNKNSRDLKVFSNQRFMPRAIHTNSFSLYLSYLVQCSTNLVLKHSQTLKFNFKKMQKVYNDKYTLKITNIFPEKLAFRHRFQLQSQKLLAPGPTFNCSFKRGNKLKSVLETFGNTITSMVLKYDNIATPPARTGEGAK